MNTDSKRAVLAALGANFGIALAKFAGFAVTRSASMLAEAVHSVADTGNQALLLWGATAASREATAEHPFGYGRERYFWAFVVALILFSLGSVFAIDHGVEKFTHAESLHDAQWAIGILVVAIALETGSFSTAIAAARPLKGEKSWWHFVQQTKSPELSVVLLEDLGALLGLVIALIGVGSSLALDDPRYDAAASILIGVLLGVIAAFLAVKMKSLLIGEAASGGDVAMIRAALLQGDDVERVIHMRTQHLSPDELLLGAKLEFSAGLSFEDLTHAIDRAEARARAQLPAIGMTIYLEPDVYELGSGSKTHSHGED